MPTMNYLMMNFKNSWQHEILQNFHFLCLEAIHSCCVQGSWGGMTHKKVRRDQAGNSY